MNDVQEILANWQLDGKGVRKRMYEAPTARERDAHTIGEWVEKLREKGPTGLTYEQSGGPPRPQHSTTGDIESSGAGGAQRRGIGAGEMELESGSTVCPGTV